MKKFTVKILMGISLLASLFGCKTKEDKAFELFNEGVKYSLEAGNEADKGNAESAVQLNEKAIEKFIETYKIDSTHQLVKSALGHSYYLKKDFSNGIYWYELANRLDTPLAVNYRELGLCKINLGEIKTGTADLHQSFKLDPSKENKEMTVLDLKDIGESAFSMGKTYSKQGDSIKGKGYQKFAIGVLWTAHVIDSTQTEIKKLIATYARQIGDMNTAKKFENN